MQLAGWLVDHADRIRHSGLDGTWFAVFPTVEALVAQVVAALLVVGSYLVAKDVRVRRPRLRGETPAQRAEQPPTMLLPAEERS